MMLRKEVAALTTSSSSSNSAHWGTKGHPGDEEKNDIEDWSNGKTSTGTTQLLRRFIPSSGVCQRHPQRWDRRRQRSPHQRRQGRRASILCCILALNGLVYLILYWRPFRRRWFRLGRDSTDNVDDDDWTAYVQDYERQFQRSPPNGLRTWYQFAKTHDCATDHLYYASLHQDMDAFRDLSNDDGRSKLQWDQVIPRGKKYTDHYMAFTLSNHALAVTDEDVHREASHRPAIVRLLRTLLEPTVQHWPPLTSTLFFNLDDVATSDQVRHTVVTNGDGDNPSSTVMEKKYPIFSVCKMDYYTDNRDVPTASTSSSSLAVNIDGTEEGPHSVVDVKYHRPPNQTNGNNLDFVASSDLLVPWHFSLRWQSVNLWWWPFYGSGIPYRYRWDAITWRGSTTSPWETGPRFQLVRKYGGTKIHPLQDSDNDKNNGQSPTTTSRVGTTTTSTTTTTTTTTTVDADFAFIKVVQKPPGVDALSPGYRFARHQFYWEMQLRKYIMDVDGNGFTSRFPGLLRSGSLVFKSTRYREWFHGMLRPYVDYIPVNYDLSDLVEKVAWAQAHPDVAERIVQHSRRQVESYFRIVDMQCYMYRLVLEYQTLFEEAPASSS